MPEQETQTEQVLPDFSLLRKPLADLSTSIQGLASTIEGVKKALSGIKNIEPNKIKESVNNKTSQQPSNITGNIQHISPPSQNNTYINESTTTTVNETNESSSAPQPQHVVPDDVVQEVMGTSTNQTETTNITENNNQTTNNNTQTYQSTNNTQNPWTTLYKNNEQPTNNTQNPWTTLYKNNEQPTNNTPKKSLISNILSGVKNSYKNIQYRQENMGETFLQSTLHEAKDRAIQAKDGAISGFKNAKSNFTQGLKAGTTGEGSPNDSIAAKTGRELGDAWKEQRDMDTPLSRAVDAFKALKQGNFKDAIGKAASSFGGYVMAKENREENEKYQRDFGVEGYEPARKLKLDEMSEDQAKERQKLVNEYRQEKNSILKTQTLEKLKQFDKEYGEKIGYNPTQEQTSTPDNNSKISENISTENVERIKDATDPQFPKPNSPHAAEYIETAGDNINKGVNQLKQKSEHFLENIKSFNEQFLADNNQSNVINFPVQQSTQQDATTSKPAPDKTSIGAAGQREAKEYGPQEVKIVNFKELAEEISELMTNKLEDKMKTTVITGGENTEDGSSEGGGLLSSLGSMLGFGGGNGRGGTTSKKHRRRNRIKSANKSFFKNIGSKMKGMKPRSRIGGLLKIGTGATTALAAKLGYDKLTSKPSPGAPDKPVKPDKLQVKSATKPVGLAGDVIETTKPAAPSTPKPAAPSTPKPATPAAVAPKPAAPSTPKPATPAAVAPKPAAPSTPKPATPAAVAPKPVPKPKAKKGFFGNMWEKTKSLGSKAMTKAKGAVSSVKKGITNLAPSKLIASAKDAISGSAGKVLKTVFKIPVIGTALEAVFATMEAKDVLGNQELTAKDKKKQVGAIIGRSVGGLMGGAIAGVGVQSLNVAPGLGLVLTPLAYMGGDFVGRMAADALMNNVEGIDTKMGDIAGGIFDINYEEGSAADPATPPADPSTLEKQVKPVDTKQFDKVTPAGSVINDSIEPTPPIPANNVSITPDEVSSVPATTQLSQAVPAAMGAATLANTAANKNKSKTSNKIKPGKPGLKTASLVGKTAVLGSVATGSALAASALPDSSPPAKKLQTGAQASGTGESTAVPANNYTIGQPAPPAKKLQTGAQAPGTGEPTAVPANNSTIGHSESEPMYVKQVQDDDGDDPDHPGEEQPEIANVQPGTGSQVKTSGIIPKVADSATAVYPGSMVGRAIEGGKTLVGKAMATETGQKAKAVGTKALDKTKQIGATAIEGGKTLVGKAMATETGQKAKAVGTKALDKGKSFATRASSMGSGLLEKLPSAATSMKLKASQTAKGIKDKISSPGLEKPIEPAPAKPKSLLGKIASGAKSLVTEHPLVKLFRKKKQTPDSESAKPIEPAPAKPIEPAPAKPKSLLGKIASGAKSLVTEHPLVKLFRKKKQTPDMGMSLVGKAKQKAAEKIPGMLTSGKAAAIKATNSVTTTARKLPGMMKSKSQALKQAIDTRAKEPNSLLGGAAKFAKTTGGKTMNIGKKIGSKAVEGGKKLVKKAKDTKDRIVTETTGENSDGDAPKDRLSGVVDAAKDKSKNFLQKAIPMSQKMGSKALAGAAIMGQRSKQFIEKLGEAEIEKENKEKERATGGGTAVITNSSNSSSTTTINRFDTDVVSKWRSQYVDDQHRPGHYSMYS
jgi:hypothetical protein